MDRQYWDNVSADYDGQIHDSLGSDVQGVIARCVLQYVSPGGVACDVGCGVGKYVPMLAKQFARVYAIDLSGKLLEQARRAHGELTNVRFMQKDLSRGSRLRIRKAHFAVCANVLIMPDANVRRAILRNVARLLVRGGHVLIVIPSMESALYAQQRLMQWCARAGQSLREARREGSFARPGDAAKAIEGIVRIDGAATKHYLREEAVVTLRDAGFDPVSIDKIEYDWTTEFHNPPRWLGTPLPWDWLFVARKQ
ncbi:MAG: class I SAM-dependent methyltransferase [Phycisphaeraceae bacterium]|jgi:2-polyprenyl-3-methyl-5-hydroxy-6-metoxy-1,4-benzoquinol methylase|nr:class I SAM-dependent methyltransferase [Phycisphaeraceae bacterium]